MVSLSHLTRTVHLIITRLTPHEDQWTDIILLGHSMGGLLAADIALVFRHGIIGIINFDVPFLGMHPGIVKAGLGSMFSPSPTPHDVAFQESGPGKKPGRVATLFNPQPSDPNYNPSFQNDVHLPVRKGLENSLHWMKKHYKDGLRNATKGLVKSHFEFGGAMADYRELKDRYVKVRVLEDDDERKRKASFPGTPFVPRIRFVNYYTASTGKPKKPKSPKSPKSPSPSRPASRQSHHQDGGMDALATSRPAAQDTDKIAVSSEPVEHPPRVSIEVQEHRDNAVVPVPLQEPPSATDLSDTVSPKSAVLESGGPPHLPAIPPIPREPPFVDLMQISDKAQRKAAVREHDQALREYQNAVKERNQIIIERDNYEEMQAKQREQAQAEPKKEPEKSIHSQSELDRLQAESKRMQAESERMQTGAQRRQANSSTHSKEQVAAPAPVGPEPKFGALQLNDAGPSRPTSQGPYSQYDFSRSIIMAQAPPDDQSSLAESGHALSVTDSQTSGVSSGPTPSLEPEALPAAQKKKLKKFCMLPPKDASGNKDATWVRVLMEGMDEVTAHTSLFFVNNTYERLVGDVGARIEEWIREADSVRLVREMEGLS